MKTSEQVDEDFEEWATFMGLPLDSWGIKGSYKDEVTLWAYTAWWCCAFKMTGV